MFIENTTGSMTGVRFESHYSPSDLTPLGPLRAFKRICSSPNSRTGAKAMFSTTNEYKTD